MRLAVIIILTLGVFSLNAQTLQTVFYDSFNDNSKQWDLHTNNSKDVCKVEIKNGKFVLDHFGDAKYDQYFTPKTPDLSNKQHYEIEADIKLTYHHNTDNGGAGLYFVRMNEENEKEFIILRMYKEGSEDYITLQSTFDGIVEKFAATEKISLPKSVFKLKMKILNTKEEQSISIYINDIEVYKKPWMLFTFEQIGIFSSDYTKIEVDNFSVKSSQISLPKQITEDLYSIFKFYSKRIGDKLSEYIPYPILSLALDYSTENLNTEILALKKDYKDKCKVFPEPNSKIITILYNEKTFINIKHSDDVVLDCFIKSSKENISKIKKYLKDYYLLVKYDDFVYVSEASIIKGLWMFEFDDTNEGIVLKYGKFSK